MGCRVRKAAKKEKKMRGKDKRSRVKGGVETRVLGTEGNMSEYAITLQRCDMMQWKQ